MSAAADRAAIRDHVAAVFPGCLRPAAGALRHPFIDPGAGYRDLLWDWDAYFCALGLEAWAPRVAPHALGCVRNLLDHQAEDGSVPYVLSPDARPAGPRAPGSVRNSAKPLLAQFALLAADYADRAGPNADGDFLEASYPGLAAHCRHWEATQRAPCGLLTFRSHRGSGADNHPAVYCRPPDSSADVFLNCLQVAEYRALAAIADRVGAEDETVGWREAAGELADRVRGQMWDPIDGCFYNLDVGHGDPGPVNQPVTWAVPLKFRAWTCAAPLWAGVATPEQAERVVREHLLAPGELRSPHGLRSLAANEPAYRVFAGSNPSDWQGPVWVVATWFAVAGLRRYGYAAEADALASDLLATLGRDLETNECLHEYYDPETGRGLTHPGFLNWNTLALRLAG